MRELILSAVAAAAATGPAQAGILDNFESAPVGGQPGAPWSDIAGSILSPTVPGPTGHVIQTPGPTGSSTRAYQIFQAHGTSQGLIAPITPADTHTLQADIRIDAHPTPERYGNWNAAFGLIQDRGVAPDINENPQGVIYVYQSRWYFFGATIFGANAVEVQLSSTPVVAGQWYHVTMNADALTGRFDLEVRNASGGIDVSASVSIPNWEPSLGRYNRVAAFDGDYAPGSSVSGQFTLDNVSYVPPPTSGAIALAAVAVRAGRRRRA